MTYGVGGALGQAIRLTMKRAAPRPRQFNMVYRRWMPLRRLLWQRVGRQPTVRAAMIRFRNGPGNAPGYIRDDRTTHSAQALRTIAKWMIMRREQ